ncbi:MAG TPA: hypothetical protein VLC46_25960 [Thermoanaerobaculia bacterium]|nr:hypothetical protein [Thermoanaerobaculia bacterium]
MKAVAHAKTSKKPAPKKPAAKAKTVKKKPAKAAAPKKASKPAVKKAAPKKAASKKAASKKAASKKAAPKKAAPKKAAPKKAAPKKAAPKKVAAKKAAPKKTSPKASKKVAPPKAAPKPAPAITAKPPAKVVAKPAARAEKANEAKVKAAVKTVVKAAPTAAVPTRVAPAADEKKRRRSRPRVTSSGPATAAWFSQGERPRSSSFIPAPPRAEAPSLVAAPPASSDRLVGSHELTEFAVRTVPVRIDIEAGGGRIYLTINPNETTLKIGEGIEWDFRYLGGADVVIEEMIIEFAKPSPFKTTIFRSRRPGAARPHRQLSGPAHESAAGKRLQYIVRAFNAFKTEMAVANPALTIT